MSEAEVVRKVRSVCGVMDYLQAEENGVVAVGDELIALYPDELFGVACRSVPSSSRGSVIQILRLDGNGIPKCVYQDGTTQHLMLDRLARQEDYEAAYKGTQ